MNTTNWTYEGYWNVVLGADRDAARVVGEFGLVVDGLEVWLAESEDAACSQGRIERPASWDGFRLRALDELTKALAVVDAPRVLDLWENNAGGLMLVSRADGVGVRGFERGQNVARLRKPGRDEFTFASDAAGWDELIEFIATRPDDERVDGALYQPMTTADIEALHDRVGEPNRAVCVASWIDGEVRIHVGRSIGASAKWYLDRVEVVL